MMELPHFSISLLSRDPHLFVEAVHDTAIDEAIRDLTQRRVNDNGQAPQWHTAIIQRREGMLLLKPGSTEFPLHGLLYSSPSCGEESEAAGGTCHMLRLLGVSLRIEDLYHGLVKVYSHIFIRDIHTGRPICESVG